MELPASSVAIVRHEQQYACGCTTTRIERILLPQPEGRQCQAHHGTLTKIIHTTEFTQEPVDQAWQLRPED